MDNSGVGFVGTGWGAGILALGLLRRSLYSSTSSFSTRNAYPPMRDTLCVYRDESLANASAMTCLNACTSMLVTLLVIGATFATGT
mmetsp:Transcript_17713/g.37015  ORF Transcript_17713/g.37015 Transcript_17713/m.37015 type:complete len:86 (+) Transcript_17713:1467-1724(+)